MSDTNRYLNIMAQLGLSRKERKAQTREAILDAAARLFALQGIAATSLDQIAGSLGLTKGAIYSSFRSKRALVDAVALRVSVPLDFEPLFQEELPLREGLRQLGRGLASLQRELSREVVLLDLEYAAETLRTPRLDRGARQRQRAELERIARQLEEAVAARGESLPVDAQEYVAVLLALGRGVVHLLARQPDAIRPESIEALFALLGPAHPG